MPHEDLAILSLHHIPTEMFSWATGTLDLLPGGCVGEGGGRIPTWRQAARSAGLGVDTATRTDLTSSGERETK